MLLCSPKAPSAPSIPPSDLWTQPQVCPYASLPLCSSPVCPCPAVHVPERGAGGIESPPPPKSRYPSPPAKPLVLQLAREYGMDFYETSACSNLNIKEV